MRLDCCAAVAILQNNGLLCQFSRELAATWMVSGSVCVDDLRLTTRSLVKLDASAADRRCRRYRRHHHSVATSSPRLYSWIALSIFKRIGCNLDGIRIGMCRRFV